LRGAADYLRNRARSLPSKAIMHFSRHTLAALVLLGLLLTSLRFSHAQSGFQYLDDEAEAGGFDITAQITKLPVEWSLAEQENGDAYRLRITTNAVELGLQRTGKLTPLATAKTAVVPGDLVLQRRGVRWNVVLDGRIVLQAEDDRWQEGKVGYRGGGIKEARLQPVEEIAFDDDFMRIAKEDAYKAAVAEPHAGPKINKTQVEETIWKTVMGKWATTGINENEQAAVAQSANPFAFESRAAGENVALGGRIFWSDYRMDVAVRPQQALAVGVVLYARDAKNYLLFEWHRDGKLRLREVLGGQSKVLAAADGEPYDDKNWYRLSIAESGSTVRAFLDDNEVLRVRTGAFGRGLAGLYSNNSTDDSDKYHGAVFDDVHVRSVNDFYDNFSTHVAGRWQPVVGTWKFVNEAVPADHTGDYTVMGEASWHEYSASADIALPSDGVAGLVVHHIAGEGAYVFRIAGSKAKVPYAGKAQIVRIGAGKSTVLADTSVGKKYDGTKARWGFGSERGYLKGNVEMGDANVRVLDAFDTSLQNGRAGLYAQRGAQGVPTLKNFAVEFPRERKTWAVVPDLYATDREATTMGGWSTPEGLWLPSTPVSTAKAADPGDKTFWHKGTFWGDGDVRVKLPDLQAGQNLTLYFSGLSREKSAAPLKLSLQNAAGSLKAQLTRGSEKLGEGAQKIENTLKDKPLEVSRRGRFLIVRTGTQDDQSTLLVAKVH
jgi:hypothetical protein